MAKAIHLNCNQFISALGRRQSPTTTRKDGNMPITITGDPVSCVLRSLTPFLKPACLHPPSDQVLVVVEGPNAIGLLCRIRHLEPQRSSLPDRAAVAATRASCWAHGPCHHPIPRSAPAGLACPRRLIISLPPAVELRPAVDYNRGRWVGGAPALAKPNLRSKRKQPPFKSNGDENNLIDA